MPKLIINSRRLYQGLDSLSTITNLDRIASEFIGSGREVKRGFLGTVMITLPNGEIHYIPTEKGVEEIIFERRTDDE